MSKKVIKKLTDWESSTRLRWLVGIISMIRLNLEASYKDLIGTK